MNVANETRTEAGGVGTLRTWSPGALLRRGDEGYEEARRLWNGAIDRRPLLIARYTRVDDRQGRRPR